jgi:hypothetical protein
MYWRLLAINPTVASEIVLSEKPAITMDADRMDRGALDQLLLHTGTLGSIYHKNPEVRYWYPTWPRSLLLTTPIFFFPPCLTQTFIRGAAGKALMDSPALNPLSRQLLVPVQRELPESGPIVVQGPGPIEPNTSSEPSSLPISTFKPPPPLPADGGIEGGLLEREGSAGEEDEDEDEDAGFAKGKLSPVRQMTTADPYANLNAAFGEYAVDAPVPRPGAAGQNAGLLF